jgi:hypothetical protein
MLAEEHIFSNNKAETPIQGIKIKILFTNRQKDLHDLQVDRGKLNQNIL